MPNSPSAYERMAQQLADARILPAEEADRIRTELYRRYILPGPDDEPYYQPMPLEEFLVYRPDVHNPFRSLKSGMGYNSGRFYYLLEHFLSTRIDDVLFWYAGDYAREMLQTSDVKHLFAAMTLNYAESSTFFLSNSAGDYLIYCPYNDSDHLVIMGTAWRWWHELQFDLHRLIGLPVPDLADRRQKSEYRLLASSLSTGSFGYSMVMGVDTESDGKLLRFRVRFKACEFVWWSIGWEADSRPGFRFSHLQRIDENGSKFIPAYLHADGFELKLKYESVSVEKWAEIKRNTD